MNSAIWARILWLGFLCGTLAAAEPGRLRVLIETDAGGDPDDEQSLVRFLLYANEWDVEGLIANRPQARAGENRNPERTGLGIVLRQIAAYGQCWTNLTQHDPRYPSAEQLRQRTVAGHNETQAAVELILKAVDSPDPRPLWYADWGTDAGAATNNLRRALDRVWTERGPDGYARFKSRLRLASADQFGRHTHELSPPFPIWIDTFRPELDRRRWYHRFSALTATAGGFDLRRDVLNDHGPLGALYPTNTTHRLKEGDSMTFIYWLPNGLNEPGEPTWGGWAGRYGPNETLPGRPYYWANQKDTWKGTTLRDHTLGRWAEALQNDFRVRLDWCVQARTNANHPPLVRLNRERFLRVRPGESVQVSAATSTDPDGQALQFSWIPYPEAGTYRGAWEGIHTNGSELSFQAPAVDSEETLHFVVAVTDSGSPALTRYARVVVAVEPTTRPVDLSAHLRPPAEFLSAVASNPFLHPTNGAPIQSVADWARRRQDIKSTWERLMGPWPALLEHPRWEVLHSGPRETFVQQRVRLEIAGDQFVEGWYLIPACTGPLPAVLIPYYEPETSVGLGTQRHRDFALQLARRGFATLAIGTPGGDARQPNLGDAQCQPLSFLAYVAANAHTALTQRPEIDPNRIGVLGHSYGGKWALFAAALYEPFAVCAVSDPGVSWDESRPNVNYWESWYLGAEPGKRRTPGLVTPDNPRTGAYRELIAGGHSLTELQSLLAPRPFFVSGGAEDPPERWRDLGQLFPVYELLGLPGRVGLTARPGHDPTPESNAELMAFFERFLAP